jgi:hypothetical protein
MGKLIITEEEKKRIIKLYKSNEDFIRPLQKLMECKFTSDGKYVIYEGIGYSCETGEISPINESWTLSDILHAGADILSAGMDFVIPGSGAVIDVLNAISYIIEAQFKSDEEKDSLYIMAAITFGFVILPGPLQVIAIPLKRAVKTGAGMASKTVVNGLKIIGKSIDVLLVNIPSKVAAALKSKFAKNILGRWGDKISGFITKFTTRIKSLLSKLTGKEGAERVGKEGVNFYNGTIDSFKKSIKKEHPMSEDDAIKFLKNYNGDYHSDFIKLGFDLPHQDVTLTAAVLKNKIKVPVGEHLYHGTTSKNLENILKNGLDNSKGSTINPGGVMSDNLGKNITTATGDINYAKRFSELSANKTNGKEVILRFKNSNNQNLTFIGQHPSIDGKYLEYSLDGGKTWIKSSGKTAVTPVVLQASKKFFGRIPKISQGAKVLRKAGFAKGYTYKYMGPKGPLKGTIQEITDDGVKILFIKNGKKFTTNVPVETFIKKSVGEPWLRRGWGVTVPLFVKRFSDMLLPDGSNIDYSKLDSLEDLDPSITSGETEEFLSGEVSNYQGDSKNYTIETNVKSFQDALQLLGYKLPRYGSDGKFGPETKQQLEKFQRDNNLTSSIGKMDRYTARKLSELLKSNKITDSDNLQTSLSKI